MALFNRLRTSFFKNISTTLASSSFKFKLENVKPSPQQSKKTFNLASKSLICIGTGAFAFGLGSFTLAQETQTNETNQPSSLKQKIKSLPLGVRIIVFGGATAFLIGINVFVIPFFISGMKKYGRIPYAPTPSDRIDAIFDILPIKGNQGKTFVDLGSGDGLMVSEATFRGFNTIGYEINPWLVWWSKRKLSKIGLSEKSLIQRKNFWEADLSKADVVYTFALDTAMKQLQDKLDKELKDGAYVVSFLWPLPDWQPVDQTETGILLYQKGESNKALETEQKEQPNSQEIESK